MIDRARTAACLDRPACVRLYTRLLGVAERIGPDLLLLYRSIGINLKQLYGSTETGLFVSMQVNGQEVSGQVWPDAAGPASAT